MLTYLYLLIYVCLSSGVILFNKVRLLFLAMRVCAPPCVFRCGRVVAKQGRVRFVVLGAAIEESQLLILC